MDQLEEIRLELVPTLRDLFLVDWPRYISAYYTIDNYINWMWLGNVQFFCLNGDWKKNGTFIIKDKNVIFFDTLDSDESLDTLKRALSLLPYDKQYRVLPFRASLRPAVQEVIKKYNLKTNNELMGHLCFLPKEIAVNIETEEIPNMSFKQLGKQHAKLIDDLWNGKCEGSRQYLERLIDYNPSLGLFDENDKLVAWILRREYGTAGLLHVQDKYRRKGYGYSLSKKFLKLLGEMGYDVTVSIIFENHVSAKIFDTLGFKKIDEDCRFEISRDEFLPKKIKMVERCSLFDEEDINFF